MRFHKILKNGLVSHKKIKSPKNGQKKKIAKKWPKVNKSKIA